MKKTFLTIAFLFLINSLVFGQAATNSTWPWGGAFDWISLIIGLVVGAVGYYFYKSRQNK